MSYLEWVGERHNPGPVGDVDSEPPKVVRNRLIALPCFFIAAAGVGAWGYLLWHWSGADHIDVFITAVLVSIMYLVISYFFLPKPDLSNLGLLGPLFDHPFRYSDDINRWLLYARIVMWPGRFFAMSLVNPFVLDAVEAREAREKVLANRKEQALQADVQEFLKRHGVQEPNLGDSHCKSSQEEAKQEIPSEEASMGSR